MIKENFKSIYDLIDMLEAECLFYEDSDKVWVKELKEFLHSLGREKVMEIERIKDEIELY